MLDLTSGVSLMYLQIIQLHPTRISSDGHPPHAVFAQFDHRERECCLEGTRTDVLSRVYRWLGFETPQLTGTMVFNTTDINVKDFPILWINGSAGTGKSTIASTIASTCRARNILGASFFCSHQDAECSNPRLIFTTIAYQLSRFCRSFGAEVSRTLIANPELGYASVSYQLEELIVNPLRVVGSAFPPCVVIIDALDVCKDKTTASAVLSSLSRYIFQLKPLKFLITSRPEPHIACVFKDGNLNSTTQKLVLHEIPTIVVERDIELYLSSQLEHISHFHGLDRAWPSKKEVTTLALLSSGLFIFAATAIRYIEDPNYSDPRHQLASLLHERRSDAESPTSPHRHLGQLYAQVLYNAFPHISTHLAGQLKLILGTIICLRDPLSPLSLELLLNLNRNTVRSTLARLHSVVLVPEDDVGVIRLLHPSFFDFMTDPSRRLGSKFVVDVRIQHTKLAQACIIAMFSLGQNICKIANPSKPMHELPDLETQLQKCFPSHLRYACRHWAFHLASSMVSEELLKLLDRFCLEYLLYWVEACSLLGDLRNSLVALDTARRVLTVSEIALSSHTSCLSSHPECGQTVFRDRGLAA